MFGPAIICTPSFYSLSIISHKVPGPVNERRSKLLHATGRACIIVFYHYRCAYIGARALGWVGGGSGNNFRTMGIIYIQTIKTTKKEYIIIIYDMDIRGTT